MKASFLDFLCCPLCHADLRLTVKTKEGEEIMGGTLDCAACQKSFPIRDGIPRFQVGPLEGDKARTVAAFGEQWRKFSWLDPMYEQQFLDWIRPVSRDFFPGKTVLDAGCGKGRHLVWAQNFGAKAVVGLDLSDAVEVAYAHTRELPNVHVAQADLFSPPCKPVFDYAYSVGVLHHTPDPPKAFRSVAALVRPQGHLSVWVYGRENNGWIIHCVNPLRKTLTSRLPPSAQRAVSGMVTALLLWPLLKLVISPLHRFAPHLAQRLFYGPYLCYIAKFSFRDIRTIVHDHLSPAAAEYIRREEFVLWFDQAQLTETEIHHHHRNSWRGFARRPAAYSNAHSR